MVVGVCKLDLRIPGCRSLKDKRRVLRKIKDRAASRFGIAVAETEHQNLWQRAEMGFAAVGNDHGVIEGVIQRVVNFIADESDVLVLDRYTEIMHI
ncbi:MAG TPA: DUF503 domain-containing protein [bacterium]|nr:DUF503 domain-containing protein [bacterium]